MRIALNHPTVGELLHAVSHADSYARPGRVGFDFGLKLNHAACRLIKAKNPATDSDWFVLGLQANYPQYDGGVKQLITLLEQHWPAGVDADSTATVMLPELALSWVADTSPPNGTISERVTITPTITGLVVDGLVLKFTTTIYDKLPTL